MMIVSISTFTQESYWPFWLQNIDISMCVSEDPFGISHPVALSSSATTAGDNAMWHQDIIFLQAGLLLQHNMLCFCVLLQVLVQNQENHLSQVYIQPKAPEN